MSIVLGFASAEGICFTLSLAAVMSDAFVAPSAVMSARRAVSNIKTSRADLPASSPWERVEEDETPQASAPLRSREGLLQVRDVGEVDVAVRCQTGGSAKAQDKAVRGAMAARSGNLLGPHGLEERLLL